MKLTSILIGTALVAATLASAAQADTVLLNITNDNGETNVPYSFDITATSASTTISVAGYQLPAYEQVTQNSFTAGGLGPNLLGTTWNFVPAASGSLADQYDEGSGVNALNFGGVSEGSYDTFSQTISTVVGQHYTFAFNYSDDYNSTPNGLLVTTSGGAGVPEPTSWALMLLGVGGLGGALRARRKAVLAA